MALIGTFIQADKLVTMALMLMQRRQVFPNICEVKNDVKASSIKVPKLTSGTVMDYVPGADMTVNNAGSTSVVINLDQAKAVNDYLDYMDLSASDQATEATKQCVNTMGNEVGKVTDKYVLKQMFDGASTGGAAYSLGVTTAPITIDASNIDDYISNMARALDDNDAPEDGRFAVVTPKMRQALTLNNIYVAATTDENARKGGFSGMYMGFEIYVSNNLPKGVAGGLAAGEAGVIFGIKGTTGVGFNYNNTRTIPAVLRFGEYFQSLTNYGAGVVTTEWAGKGCVVA